MSTRISICARSPLGKLLAMSLVTAVLLYAGLYLATDGGINLKTLSFLQSYSTPAMQDRQRDLLQAITDRFKKYDRVELLALYGFAILAGFMVAGLLGGMIRSYRFTFSRGNEMVQRQALWLCVPVWLLAWIIMGLIVLLAVGMARSVTIWLPLWVWVALGVAGLVQGIIWTWRPEWLAGRRVKLPRVGWRVPAWVVVLAATLAVMMVVGLIGRWFAMISVAVPAGLLAMVLVPPVALIPARVFLPAIVRRTLYIPGLRRQVAFARIKRMEVEAQADGGTTLVVTFHDQWSWTIREGSPSRLQRLGGVLGRVVGLKRRDLVTWG